MSWLSIFSFWILHWMLKMRKKMAAEMIVELLRNKLMFQLSQGEGMLAGVHGLGWTQRHKLTD